MSGLMDDPNRESLGLDPAWVEGTGGTGGDAEPKSLDEMTKGELLAEAERRGLDVDASSTKAQLRDAIDEDEAG